MGKKSTSGSGIRIWENIPDHIFESLETIFWIKSNSILCCGSLIRNLFDPGSGIRNGRIRIRDKHPGSATLGATLIFCGKRWHSRFENKNINNEIRNRYRRSSTNLRDKGEDPDNIVDGIGEEAAEDISLAVDLPGVDFVEEGHHHKGVENHRKVDRRWSSEF
jgi:hypothetical protein